MLISLEREDDKKTLQDLVEMLETTVRIYLESKNDEFLIHIEWLNESIDALRLKIDAGNYAEADARRMRVNQLLNARK